MVRLPSSCGLAPVRALAASIPALAMLLLLGAPASAQDTPPERITPPIRYSLPPGESSEIPAPVPTPTRAPPPLIVVPTPAPEPTPRARPTLRATPAIVPTPTPTSAAPVPSAQPTGVPIELSPTAATPVQPLPAPSPEITAATPVQPAEADWTWWMLAGGLALVAAAALLAWRRRDTTAAAEFADPAIDLAPPVLAPTPPVRRAATRAAEPEMAEAAMGAGDPRGDTQFLTVPARPASPTPVVAPDGTLKAFQNRPRAPAPPPPAADAGFITAFRSPAAPAPMLALELQPIRAGCTEDSGFVEYTFAVVNPSDVVVGDLLVSAWLVSANPQQDRQLLDYLAEPADPSPHNVFALRPGEHRELRAAMGVPFDQLHLVEAAGRRFFAPMLLLDARYRTQSGVAGRTSAAYVIGRPHPSSGKLAPVFVDRGPRVVEGLAARPYRLPRPTA